MDALLFYKRDNTSLTASLRRFGHGMLCLLLLLGTVQFFSAKTSENSLIISDSLATAEANTTADPLDTPDDELVLPDQLLSPIFPQARQYSTFPAFSASSSRHRHSAIRAPPQALNR